jgi:hypothetical protein
VFESFGYDARFCLEVANGINAPIDWKPMRNPKRRLVIRGDVDSMTLVAEGTLTAGSVAEVTDTGASFGTANEQVGRLLVVWDPTDLAGTLQRSTIKGHTDTSLVPDTALSPVPDDTWSYEVLDPAGRIVATSGAAIDLSLGAKSGNPGPNGPGSIVFAWLKVERDSEPERAIEIDGGFVSFMGVVVEGASVALSGNDSFLMFGGYVPEEEDPVFGLDAESLSFRGASLGVRRFPAEADYALWLSDCNAVGCPVVWGANPIGLDGQSNVTFEGGTCIAGPFADHPAPGDGQ